MAGKVGGDVAAPQGSRALAAFSAKTRGTYKHKVSNEGPAVIVPTGSLALDRALRVGGWQQGRVYEIVGPPDSCKTTLMTASMISFSRTFPDRGVAYANMEGTFSPERAMAMGLDCSDEALESGRWAQLWPESSEDASNLARHYCNSGLYSVIVIDSIGQMESKKVLDIDADKDTMGKNAGIITKMNKALATGARLHKCTILLVNQPRANFSGYGGDISAGPKHMKHATTAKVDMRALGDPDTDLRKMKLPGDDEPVIISQQFAARVSRMKNGVSGRTARFFSNKISTNEYGPVGIDVAGEYLDIGVSDKIIVQGGGWYTFPDGHKEQGRPAAGRYLRDNPKAAAAIRAAMTFDAPVSDLEDEEDD